MNLNLTRFLTAFYSLSLFLLYSCSSGNNHQSPFEIAVSNEFDGYLKQLGTNPDKCDTLYTEMYIALQLFKEKRICGDTVINRVNQLLILDKFPENKRHYIEAAQLIYRIQEDYDNFWKMSLKEYDTYPLNSIERNSSLATYYSNIEQNTDSAIFYIDKTKLISKEYITSNNPKNRIEGYLVNINMLILENNELEAKKLITNYIESETDEEALKFLKEILNNFDDFKSSINMDFNLFINQHRH